MSCNQQNYEYFKRFGFDAAWVYDRLIEEIVNQLRKAEDGYQNYYKPSETDFQPYRYGAAVFYNNGEQGTENSSEEWSYIRYYVENPRQESYADSCVET